MVCRLPFWLRELTLVKNVTFSYTVLVLQSLLNCSMAAKLEASSGDLYLINYENRTNDSFDVLNLVPESCNKSVTFYESSRNLFQHHGNVVGNFSCEAKNIAGVSERCGIRYAPLVTKLLFSIGLPCSLFLLFLVFFKQALQSKITVI